jgi:hypothetical protein
LTEGNEENKDCFSACAIWMDASLPWFSSVQKNLHFPRNSRPNLAQYISERPEVTSQRAVKEGQTTNKENQI